MRACGAVAGGGSGAGGAGTIWGRDPPRTTSSAHDGHGASRGRRRWRRGRLTGGELGCRGRRMVALAAGNPIPSQPWERDTRGREVGNSIWGVWSPKAVHAVAIFSLFIQSHGGIFVYCISGSLGSREKHPRPCFRLEALAQFISRRCFLAALFNFLLFVWAAAFGPQKLQKQK
jgi:hypothetical protein